MAVSDPATLPQTFVEAFNAKDLAAIDRLFEPGAVRVLRPGVVVSGDGRLQATSSFLALGVPIEISLRHTYVYDDTALLIGDFVIDGATRRRAGVHRGHRHRRRPPRAGRTVALHHRQPARCGGRWRLSRARGAGRRRLSPGRAGT